MEHRGGTGKEKKGCVILFVERSWKKFFLWEEGRDKLNCLKDFAIQTGQMTLPSNSNICCFLSMAGSGDEESSRGRAEWRASEFFEIQPHIRGIFFVGVT